MSRHTRWSPRSALAVGLTSIGAALALAPGAQAAEAPSFQCRASALTASVAGQPYIEPLVANGIKGSVPGATFDKPACTDDEQGAGDVTTSLGLQDLVGTSAVREKTTIVPNTGSSAAQTATATTTIADLDLKLLGPGTLKVGAVKATATGKCVNGKAQFTGTSEVTGITLAGQPISLDQLVNGIGDLLRGLGLDPVVKVFPLNQVTITGNSVVVTPLRIQVLSGGAATGGLVDLTVGETKVAQRGNACDPSGGGGDGTTTVCPVGSIPVGTTPAVCQIPGTDRYGTIIIGVPGSNDVPTGGRVVALPEARALAAAGTIPKSNCLSGPGLNYVVLGDKGKDTVFGTRHRDRIMTLAGNDVVNGRNQSDCVDGGSGNDRLAGDTGDDRIYGGSGKDRINADRGNDRAYGGSGNDRIYGSFGNDKLYGESGNDKLYGNDGKDTLSGGGGTDRLSGGFNSNTLIAGKGHATVFLGKPTTTGHSTVDLRKTTAPSVVKCGSRRDVIRVNRKFAKRNRYSSNCTKIRVSR
ncbi:calcium-binding protein [Patulibacter sp. NPDC049589]|uniref:calcium-binding protein n=1 Tax=Patulibacter sp. NPDC049589 TaxID=3154731 RepID=UPI00342E4CCA